LPNIKEFGEKLQREHTKFKTNSPIFIGMMNATVDDGQIMQCLTNKKSKFNNKFLIFVPADEDLSKID